MAYKRKTALPVSEGGTGATSLTQYRLLAGNGTSAVQVLASTGTTGDILISQGASALPTWTAASTYGVSSVNSQTGAVTISGGTTGASFTGSTGTVTMSFAGITANAGTVNIGSDSTDNAVNISTAASSGRTTTIGNTTGSSTLALKYGTGGFQLASASGNTMTATSAGLINYPLTTCFLENLSTSLTNKTGSGSSVTVDFTGSGTEIFDQNSNYSSNTLTAAVTGKYQFDMACELSGLTSSHIDAFIVLVTSNRTFLVSRVNPSSSYVSGGYYTLTCSMCADMDASDTAYMQVNVGGSTAVVGFVGNTSPIYTYFDGFLAC